MADDENYYLTARKNLEKEILALATPLDCLDDLKVERVLDVACGIGQALYPHAVCRGVPGIGVDVSELGLKMGRQFYAEHFQASGIVFIKAAAESLPFPDASFDLVNCSLALPYTDNARTLREVSRVLRPGGVLLLKIHHLRYYLRKLSAGLAGLDPLSMIHSGRVLTAGTIYHLLRRQPQTRLLNETYQTKWLLQLELARHGLAIEGLHGEQNPESPAYIIRKPAVCNLKRDQRAPLPEPADRCR